jgi:ankyrin repeat protein
MYPGQKMRKFTAPFVHATSILNHRISDALHSVIPNAETRLLRLAEEGNVTAVRPILLTSGVHVDAKNSKGETPLMLASSGDHTELVDVLTNEFHADPFVLDQRGLTARGRLEKAGGHERMALMMKIYENECAEKRLLSAAAKGDVISLRSILRSSVIGVDAGTIDVDTFNSKGETPLIVAAAGGHVAVIFELMYVNASPFAAGQDNLTARGRAEKAGHDDVVCILTKYEKKRRTEIEEAELTEANVSTLD